MIKRRWNNLGTPVIYKSASRSLAALEVIVDNGAIPVDHRLVVMQLPDSLSIESVAVKRFGERVAGRGSGHGNG